MKSLAHVVFLLFKKYSFDTVDERKHFMKEVLKNLYNLQNKT